MEVDDEPVLAALGRLMAAVGDPDPALGEIGRAWLTEVQLGFRSGRDPYGQPWRPPLRGGQPLRDTGRLRDSFTYHVGSGELELGTNVRYARPHQQGATIRARHQPYLVFRVGERWARKRAVELPRRRMLPDEGLPEHWRETALQILQDHITEAL